MKTVTLELDDEAVGRGFERELLLPAEQLGAHVRDDGALGAELIGAFKTLIENPIMMMV